MSEPEATYGTSKSNPGSSDPVTGNRADTLDTGQWHLAVDISAGGLGAWLIPDESLGRSPRTLVNEHWEPSDEGLLTRIENAVYDNPTILDDYSADIVIESNRQLWLPAELYPTDEDCAEAYVSVYGGDTLDVMVNELGDEKVAYMLTGGLKSFMQRSFPGARIWSQQALLKGAAMSAAGGIKTLIDIREGQVDFITLRHGELLSASTHPWKTETDIAYTLFLTLQTYGVDPKETETVMSGIREVRQSLGPTLSPLLKSVSPKNHDLEGRTIPTGVYLAINRKKRNANHQR